MDRVTLQPIGWTWADSGRPAPPLPDPELQFLREVVSALTDRDIAAKLAQYGLTDRELQVLREIVLGQSNCGTAEKLGIDEGEVQHHLSLIFDKTGTCGHDELLQLFRDNLP
jgi:DNA-binding CsgD family transcriptional regulator